MQAERVLPLSGVHNFRDYGGYAVEGGGRLRNGMLWRSAQHEAATDEDLTAIDGLGLDTIIDLRGDGPVRMGIPSDVPRGSKQSLARKWSVAFHDHPEEVDGIIYPSRLNGETNLAVYDRAVGKLVTPEVHILRRTPGLGRVLNDLAIAII